MPKDLLKFLTKIIIGGFIIIGLTLNLKHHMDIVQRKHRFGNSNKDQGSNLIPAVLFFDGIVDDLLLDIVADHRAGDADIFQRA